MKQGISGYIFLSLMVLLPFYDCNSIKINMKTKVKRYYSRTKGMKSGYNKLAFQFNVSERMQSRQRRINIAD